MSSSITALIVGLVLVTTFNLIYLYRAKSNQSFESSVFVGLFHKEQLSAVEFIRNKIVVTLKDIENFNLEQLKEKGGRSINVVGDKVKFFISDKKEENELVFKEINNILGGK